MKEKVKLIIVPLFQAVAIQCLYLDERFYADHNESSFEAKNGFEIQSANEVEAGEAVLNLYHDKEYPEDCITTYLFDTDAERDAWIVKAREALTEWAQSWPGFKDSDAPEPLSPGTGDTLTIHV